MDEHKVPRHVEELLAIVLARLGLDVESPELARTPLRMATALAELTRAARIPFDPAEVLDRRFSPPSDHPQMVFLKDIPFISVCEHHMLPFTGTATVGYLPQEGAKIAGISKLARLVQGYAAQPQMQERLGQQVVDALGKHLSVKGAGCLIDATHMCLTLRGPRAEGAHMVTSHLTGSFLVSPIREEFLALARS